MISVNLSKHNLVAFSLLIGLILCVCVSVPFLKKSSSSPFLGKESLLAKFATPKWTNYTSSFSIVDAFVADTDSKGEPVFICRAIHESYSYWRSFDLIPGIFNPRKASCIISYGGKAYEYKEFQVFTVKGQSSLTWINTSRGLPIKGSVIGGLTRTEDELPIAKFIQDGQILIGKAHDRYKLAYAAYNGLEIENPYYDLLCVEDNII